MANGLYFRFDNDDKIKYIYTHNHHKSNWKAENAQAHMLYKDNWEN